jgi:two-component system, OmpR family, KDP operon response regulator KdpE
MTEQGARILVVDDERAIRRFLRTALCSHGYTVFEGATAAEALQGVQIYRPDVLILDLGLPDGEGIEVTRRLRTWTLLPIIILSVRDQESDKVAALDAGGDDYLTKPFGVAELLARLRAALRRTAPTDVEGVFKTDELEVDLNCRKVRIRTKEIQLTPTEYDILKVLVAHPGRVLTHRQLLRQVWGEAYAEDSHLLRVHISNLRAKLEADPLHARYLLTESGVGYRLKAD